MTTKQTAYDNEITKALLTVQDQLESVSQRPDLAGAVANMALTRYTGTTKLKASDLITQLLDMGQMQSVLG